MTDATAGRSQANGDAAAMAQLNVAVRKVRKCKEVWVP
jgi:hypothetical protein